MIQRQIEEFQLDTILQNFDEKMLRSGTIAHGDEEETEEPPAEGGP